MTKAELEQKVAKLERSLRQRTAQRDKLALELTRVKDKLTRVGAELAEIEAVLDLESRNRAGVA